MFFVRCKGNRSTYVAAPGRIQFTDKASRAWPFPTLEEAQKEANRYPTHREVVEVCWLVRWRVPNCTDDWLDEYGDWSKLKSEAQPFDDKEEAKDARHLHWMKRMVKLIRVVKRVIP